MSPRQALRSMPSLDSGHFDKRWFTFSLCLGFPSEELEIQDAPVTDTDAIRAYAYDQFRHLHTLASRIDKLWDAGWIVMGRFCSVECTKLCTRSEAESDLVRLGLKDWIEDLEENNVETRLVQ